MGAILLFSPGLSNIKFNLSGDLMFLSAISFLLCQLEGPKLATSGGMEVTSLMEGWLPCVWKEDSFCLSRENTAKETWFWFQKSQSKLLVQPIPLAFWLTAIAKRFRKSVSKEGDCGRMRRTRDGEGRVSVASISSDSSNGSLFNGL